MLDIGDNPEAPQPREMIDLEVCDWDIKFNCFYCGFDLGDVWKARKWIERSEYKCWSVEKNVFRIVWIEAHFKEDSAVFRWGNEFLIQMCEWIILYLHMLLMLSIY